MYTNNYSNIERFDKVIAKIKWCSFLPHSVVYVKPTSEWGGQEIKKATKYDEKSREV